MVELARRPELPPASFNPELMGGLETCFIRARIEDGEIRAKNFETRMHIEQYNLSSNAAELLVNALNSKKLDSYYTYLTFNSGLIFNCKKASTTHAEMLKRMSNKIYVPVPETKELLGIIYTINSKNKDLAAAVESRKIAYSYRDNNWELFEKHLVSYYALLKQAANEPKDLPL